MAANMTLRDLTGWILHRRPETVAVQEVSREEIIRTIDELARKRRGMSAHQLLCAYRAGRLEISGDVTDLLVYSDLLSPNDPIFDSSSAEAEPETHYACR
jgi:hypothetical protein